MNLVAPTAEDFLWQFQRLLPRGRIWHRGWGTTQAADLLTLMPTWVRLNGRANDLIVDAFPCTTRELLPEWEATLGLPDPCVEPPLSTIQQRVAAVCAKFRARGGQSVPYFLELAESLGYDVSITTYQPFRVGINRVSEPLYGPEWAFAWKVTIHGLPDVAIYFRVGTSTVGERLRTVRSNTLQCIFESIKPAHTEIVWSYTIDQSVWDQGASIWDAGASIWDQGASPVVVTK